MSYTILLYSLNWFIHYISQTVCNNGDIRLVGGTTTNEGRVEVCKNQLWGTICDDFWSSVDARVACGQLGFSRLSRFNYHALLYLDYW